MWVQKTEDQGIWNEYVDDVTGESSIKEHTPKTVWQSCPEEDHYWELQDRTAVCKKCGAKLKIIIGLQKIIDGKIIPI